MKTLMVFTLALSFATPITAGAGEVGQWNVFETSFETQKTYAKPFTDLEVNVVFSCGEKRWVVPAFWAGSGKWTVRFAPPEQGEYRFRVECTDKSNTDLNGPEQTLRVAAYQGKNPLLKHGFLRVSADRRHFEHADGTPFFWLGDTWWKGLCKRLTWEGFQELVADRKAKGFTVVQIVCGVYPDEGLFEPRWENEGGKPYLTRDFSVVNPGYFQYADRRIKYLVDSGLVPAIVGGWGRGDCNGMAMAGITGIKRHWRNLIARYGAYPMVWIIGGESGGPQWTEVARYVQKTDPYRHPSTIHPFHSARQAITDVSVIDFDMLQTGHGDWPAARGAIPKFQAAYARKPTIPVVIGEYCYEGHMQTGFSDIQRYVFWGTMLSGSAGHTYGAAGIWHAGVEGDPGTTPIYDWTTWREGMIFPGATQLGRSKKLLDQYPWWQFQPHPEWTKPNMFAAGIPGKVRFLYIPRREVYDWAGPVVKGLEPGIPYHTYYFDPVRGTRHEVGTVLRLDPMRGSFVNHTQPLLFADTFQGTTDSAWKDQGSLSRRKDGRLIGIKGMVTVLETIKESDLTINVRARSDAEAGIILRFQDVNNYLVALYSPLLKAIYLHDRKDGNWGPPLGKVDVPDIGPNIELCAASSGKFAAMSLNDGKRNYHTPILRVGNVGRGKVGLWLYQVGNWQEFTDFKVSRSQPITEVGVDTLLETDEYRVRNLPSPQDWVLVLERAIP